MQNQIKHADEKGPKTPVAGDQAGPHHAELKGMTYEEGAQALAPQLGADAPPKPFTTPVVQFTRGRFEDNGSKSLDELIFSGGENRKVTVGTKVVCEGTNGRVVEVYAKRARAVFYETLVNPQTVDVRLGETWTKAQEDAYRQKRDQEAAKKDEKRRFTEEHATRR